METSASKDTTIQTYEASFIAVEEWLSDYEATPEKIYIKLDKIMLRSSHEKNTITQALNS